MGSVEVAVERGAGSIERMVALKRLLPQAANDLRHTEMFLREARLAALLNHPNVVHAFDFGALEGELFLAMEYVEGETLSAVIRRVHDQEGAFAPALAAYILAEACDGLHAAHELCDVNGTMLNVVHRDVSPHNVVVSYEGHVKLLDFGVAKIDTERGITRTGEVKGKTAYMSPEQAMGDKLDRRSDLYSVGSVLYECLAGEKMWGDGTDIEVIRRLALESPPRLENSAKSAPAALADLHARLVSKDLSARPATARSVSEELRAFVAETGTRPDARVIRAVMTRLFAAEAAARKTQLTAALAEAKRALAAGENTGSVTIAAPEEGTPAPQRDSTSAVIARPRAGRTGAWVAGVALASTVLGAAVVFAAREKDSVTATLSVTPPPSTLAVTAATSPPPAGPPTIASAAASSSPAVTVIASATNRESAKVVTKRPPAAPSRSVAAASASAPTPRPKVDDVDPNPLAK